MEEKHERRVFIVDVCKLPYFSAASSFSPPFDATFHVALRPLKLADMRHVGV